MTRWEEAAKATVKGEEIQPKPHQERRRPGVGPSGGPQAPRWANQAGRHPIQVTLGQGLEHTCSRWRLLGRQTDGERQAACCVWNRGGVAGGSPSCTAIACKNWEKLEKKSMELRGQETLRKKTKHSAGADAMKQVGKDLREVECTHPERLRAHHLSVWTETPEYPVWNPGGCSPDERRWGECLGVAGCGGRSQAE